ncbi:hypothetical protein [Serratia fonticola]
MDLFSIIDVVCIITEIPKLLGFTQKIAAAAMISILSSSVYSHEIMLGINAHILHQDASDANKTLDKITSLNASLIRIDIPWKIVEGDKGLYSVPKNWDSIINAALSKGLHPVLILDYGNKFYNRGDKPISDSDILAFANYAKFIVSHFKGKIKYYQIWNEWDGKVGNTSPGSTRDYQRLVKQTYPIIKRADPDSLVITGSFSAGAFNKYLGIDKRDFLSQFLTPEMARYTDIIAIHPYTTYRKKPFSEYWAYLAQVKYATSLIGSNKYFKSKPIFITEIGWSTSSSKDGVNEMEQSKNIYNAICDAKKMGVAAIIVYEMRDGSDVNSDTESGFGLLKYDWSEKDSYNSFLKAGKC